MKIEDLFKVVDTKIHFPDITIVDDANSRSVKTFKYPQDGINYVNEMLSQFGDRIIIPGGVTFGTDEYNIDYLMIEVK